MIWVILCNRLTIPITIFMSTSIPHHLKHFNSCRQFIYINAYTTPTIGSTNILLIVLEICSSLSCLFDLSQCLLKFLDADGYNLCPGRGTITLFSFQCFASLHTLFRSHDGLAGCFFCYFTDWAHSCRSTVCIEV